MAGDSSGRSSGRKLFLPFAERNEKAESSGHNGSGHEKAKGCHRPNTAHYGSVTVPVLGDLRRELAKQRLEVTIDLWNVLWICTRCRKRGHRLDSIGLLP